MVSETVTSYLSVNGYGSVEEWAVDSDYRVIVGDGGDFWVDDEGYVVDIVSQLLAVIEGSYDSVTGEPI